MNSNSPQLLGQAHSGKDFTAIEALDAQWIAQHEAIAAEGDIDGVD